MWKFVKNENGKLVSPGGFGTIKYILGETVEVEDYDPDRDVQCSFGIHCLRWREGDEPFKQSGVIFSSHIIELKVEEEDVIYDDGPNTKCRVCRAKVVREVDPPEDWMLTGNNPEGSDEALLWAVRCGSTEVVKRQVEAGANIHKWDNYALRLAVDDGHIEVVKLLLDEGANIHAWDDYALRWVVKNGHTEIVKLLEDHIAKEGKG